MPFSYTIHPDLNLIHEVWTDAIDISQLYARCKAEWADPRYSKRMDLLSDFRGAQTDISHEQMSEFAQYMDREEAVRRHAIVVTRRLGFGLARMFEALSGSTSPYWDELRVFTDIEAANVWIARSPA